MQPTAPASEPALLLDVAAVAALLGCSTRHVWRLADSGEFPRPITIGAKLRRWARSVVLAYIEAQTAAASRR